MKLAVSELPLRVAAKTAVWVTEIVPAVSATATVVAPAGTVTEGGALRSLSLLLKLTTVPPVGADCEMATLQLVAPPELSVDELHESEDKVGAGLSVTLTVLEEPFRVAVKTGAWATNVVPAMSTTEAPVVPAATARRSGVAKKLLLLLKATTVPPVGAVCEMTTLHVVAPPELTVVGVQANEDRLAAGLSVKLAVLELPLRVAVKTAVCAVAMVPAVSMTEAAVAPAAMVTDTGVAKKLLLLLRLTAVPPAGAACERTTLQVAAPPELSVVGVHANDDKLAAGLSVKLAVLELPFRVAVKQQSAPWTPFRR